MYFFVVTRYATTSSLFFPHLQALSCSADSATNVNQFQKHKQLQLG